MRIALGLLCGCFAFAQTAVVFLGPLQKIETNVAEVRAERPAYRVVDGAKRCPIA